jgi:hypothetical protein
LDEVVIPAKAGIHINNLKQMKKIVFKSLVCISIFTISSCEPEETCETKQNCFTRPDGSKECFDVPTNCVNNDFGF